MLLLFDVKTMAFNEGLAVRIRQCFEPGTTEEKRMFGGLAFMYKDYMCCGIVGDTLMLRVPRDEYADILDRKHVRQMDFTGKSLKGFVYVEPEGFETDAALLNWVEIGRQTVHSFPPKKSKKK